MCIWHRQDVYNTEPFSLHVLHKPGGGRGDGKVGKVEGETTERARKET